MLTFHPGEREHLLEMRMLTTDRHGHELIVGLSLEDSEFYLAYSRDPDSLRQSGDRRAARSLPKPLRTYEDGAAAGRSRRACVAY